MASELKNSSIQSTIQSFILLQALVSIIQISFDYSMLIKRISFYLSTETIHLNYNSSSVKIQVLEFLGCLFQYISIEEMKDDGLEIVDTLKKLCVKSVFKVSKAGLSVVSIILDNTLSHELISDFGRTMESILNANEADLDMKDGAIQILAQIIIRDEQTFPYFFKTLYGRLKMENTRSCSMKAIGRIFSTSSLNKACASYLQSSLPELLEEVLTVSLSNDNDTRHDALNVIQYLTLHIKQSKINAKEVIRSLLSKITASDLTGSNLVMESLLNLLFLDSDILEIQISEVVPIILNYVFTVASDEKSKYILSKYFTKLGQSIQNEDKLEMLFRNLLNYCLEFRPVFSIGFVCDSLAVCLCSLVSSCKNMQSKIGLFVSREVMNSNLPDTTTCLYLRIIGNVCIARFVH